MRNQVLKSHHTYTDLKYHDEYIFNEGWDAYAKNASNPYYKWQQKERDDWFAGYLAAERTHRLKLSQER